MALLWLLAGGAIGLANGWLLWQGVARLRPDASARAVAGMVGGAALRWALVTALLVVALRQGVVSGVLAFAGLWLVRWGLIGWWSLGRKVEPPAVRG